MRCSFGLISLLAVATLTCARADGNSAAAAQRVVSSLGDTETVRTVGVPTDLDDTARTRYGRHYTPRRLSNPECRPRGVALCLEDTATTVFSIDCCMDNQRQTDWLVFAAARDSLQLFLQSTSDAYLTMTPSNAAGAIGETSRGLDASWLRARFPTAGSYVFNAGIQSDSAIAYELRVAPVITTGASQPTGAAVRLTVTGARNARIAVAPRAMMPNGDSAAMRRFAVKPGTYWVLLVRDTVYSACALPCVRPIVFALSAGHAVRIAP